MPLTRLNFLIVNCNERKTGPEADRYFHVPLALRMGYNTREK